MSSDCLRVGIDLRSLANPEFRGFSRYTYEITEALASRPSVSVMGFTDTELAHSISVPVMRFTGAREALREQWSLPRMLARHDIDVFLCPSNRGLPFLSPCPTVLVLHDAVEWDSSLVQRASGKSRWRFTYASVASMAGASLIITVSEASARSISQRLHIKHARIRRVYEAANAAFHALPEPTDDRIRRDLGVNGRYLLYVGGFDRKKDVLTLVRAFAQVREIPDTELLLAGKLDADAEPITTAVQALGLGGLVRFLGYVPDTSLPALYRGAEAFVFPALAEGFGLPIVEAMACGTPVIAADAGSLPEIIGTGGQLVEAGDVTALGRALRQVLVDVDAQRNWTAAALSRARNFSWERAAEQTEAVLREAVRNKALRTLRSLGRVAGTLARCL